MNDDPFDGRPLRTCVAPTGRFRTGIHRPHFTVANLRKEDLLLDLGATTDGQRQDNGANFPPTDVQEPGADTIFEIPNPLPFRGVTYICRSWADSRADDPEQISIPAPPAVSLHGSISGLFREKEPKAIEQLLLRLPSTLQLALAETATDPRDLVLLAEASCRLHHDPHSGRPTGLVFDHNDQGRPRPWITDHRLFEVVVNNPHLPDDYKEAMVLRPGVQGSSEIVGDWRSGKGHVFEYLRRNSYIPWGHYAANMASDAVRYAMGDVSSEDIAGMRHLYYQRTYVRLAESLGLAPVARRRPLSSEALEALRQKVLARLSDPQNVTELPFNASLWGWNYGFGYAPSGYRLHASHQQIHQQFAMVPRQVSFGNDADFPGPQTYACGDLIADFVEVYRQRTGADFFTCYRQAMASNRRLDGRTDLPADLVVHADAHALLFVPKAQTSQWELQLMPCEAIGNILEADAETRRSLDRALYLAMRVLTGLGAAMVTVIEFNKRFDAGATGQRLLYDFLPKIPESPGGFSEAQLRWINGHYPEDFARACRRALARLSRGG